MKIEFIPTSYYNNLGIMKYKNKIPRKPQYYMCFLEKSFLPSIIQTYNNLMMYSDYIIELDKYPDKEYNFIITNTGMTNDVIDWCYENLKEWDRILFRVRKSRHSPMYDGHIVSTNNIADAMAIKLRWA